MTEDQILDEVLVKEGGFRAQVTRPDGTLDYDTNYGVTAPVLGEWLGLNRKATTEEVKNLKPDMARTILRKKYITGPGFTSENIPFEPLRAQLIDFGINSGPERAVRWLQRVLGLPPDAVDGRLGRLTLTALNWPTLRQTMPDLWYQLVNDALVAARSYMIDRAVDTGSIRKADEEGLESRALNFFLAKP